MIELKKVQSICPLCHKLLEAAYIWDGEQVRLVKTCPLHGEFSSYMADSAEEFMDWTHRSMNNVPPKKPLTKGAGGNGQSFDEDFDSQCPLHCGLCENHLQTACCVLIDVTERCNQRCPYCFAKAGDSCAEEPDLEEMARKYDLLLALGEERPFNIQLSGGEPTVREDLPEIIRLGKAKGFEYIQINTNGRRIALEEGYADRLKDAGASVIYLQFDGTCDGIYEALRGEPLFEIKKKAVENCRKARLPVTLVPTVVKNVNLSNIGAMMDFLLENVDVVKGIHFQPVSFFGRHPDQMKGQDGKHQDYENRVTLFDVLREIEKQSGGRIKYEDFDPIRSGHQLCSFRSTFRKLADGGVKCLISEDAGSDGPNSWSAQSQLEIVRRDRDFILKKWSLADPAPGDQPVQQGGSREQTQTSCGCGEKPEPSRCQESSEPACSREKPEPSCCGEPAVMDFDSFLADMKGSMFTVTGMAFQDVSNLDAERLKRCRVHVLSKDDRVIPFCAYNSLYRAY